MYYFPLLPTLTKKALLPSPGFPGVGKPGPGNIANPDLTGLTTACMIQDVRNDQVFNIFMDAYTNYKGYGTLRGGCPEHVEFARI